MEFAYTLGMLADEFRTLTPSWNIYAKVRFHRKVKGFAIHETEFGENGEMRMNDAIQCLPARIQEDAGRGMCVFIEQFPSGGRTTSSNDPPPSASIHECPLRTHSPPCL
jgi:hypothetical protein